MFDNSGYDKSSKFYFDENKKVIGKFKDEAAGNPIKDFTGHKSKMYSYEVELPGDKEVKNNTRKLKALKKMLSSETLIIKIIYLFCKIILF